MPRHKNDFDEFLREVEQESRKAGREALKDLETYGEHFRLARQFIVLRRRLGWTQQQLAKESGIQQSEISRIERGQGNPTYTTLEALARATNMTVALIPRRPSRRARRRLERRAA